MSKLELVEFGEVSLCVCEECNLHSTRLTVRMYVMKSSPPVGQNLRTLHCMLILSLIYAS